MSERNNKMELLGSAPIPKALMALGVPIMIGMLINALYNLVDAYFVGGLGESSMYLRLFHITSCYIYRTLNLFHYRKFSSFSLL